jgi:hypothetical protein
MAFGAIGLVVVVVVALVIVKVATGSSSGNGTAPVLTVASPSTLAQVTGVSASVAGSVGLPSGITVPSVAKDQPRLTSGGKPEVFYVGAEYCPNCAAERWAIIMAFSRFGSFTGLEETTSSPWENPPGPIPTFSFHGSHYKSNYITFDTVEHETNDTGPNQAGRAILEPLTSQESNLWSKYTTHFGLPYEAYPFIDFGNKVFVLGASYNPTILTGQADQATVASNFKNPKNDITQAVVGTANYLTAAVCSVTGNQPSSVCSASVVTQAEHAMGAS